MERIKVTEALAFLQESNSPENPEYEKALLRYNNDFGPVLDPRGIKIARKEWLSNENGSAGARRANHLLAVLRHVIANQRGLPETQTILADDVIIWIDKHRSLFNAPDRTAFKSALRAHIQFFGGLIQVNQLHKTPWNKTPFSPRTQAVYASRIQRVINHMLNHAVLSSAPPKPIAIPEGGKLTGQLTPPPFDWVVLNEILNPKPRNTEEQKAQQGIRRCKNRATKAGGFGLLIAKSIDGKLAKEQAAIKRDVALAFCAHHLLQNKGQRFTFSELHQECVSYFLHFHKDAKDFLNRDHLALETERYIVDSFNFHGEKDYTGRGKNQALYVWWDEEEEKEEDQGNTLSQTEEVEVTATLDGQDINEVEYIATLLQDLPGFISCVSYEDEIFVHFEDYWVTLASDTHDIQDVRVRAAKIAGRPKNVVFRFGTRWVPWTDYAGSFRVAVNQLKANIWECLGIETVEKNGDVQPDIPEELVVSAPVAEAVVEQPTIVEPEPVVEVVAPQKQHTLTLEGFLSFAKDYDASELNIEVKGATLSKDLIQQFKDRIMQVKDKRRQVHDFAGTLVSSLEEVLVDLEAKEKALQNLLGL